MTTSRSEAAPRIARLARVGYVAKGILYATIGVLAAMAALGHGDGGATDTRGAMAAALAAPFGRVLVALIAVGLVGYASWRIVEAVADPERRGTDAKGLAVRASYLGRGLLHLALAFTAVKLAMGHPSSSGNTSETATATAFRFPGGTWLVWVTAVGVVGFGCYQLYRAATGKLSRQLDRAEIAAEAGDWVIAVSRVGIAARGLVFIAIGWLLSRAASTHDATQAGGVADALGALARLGRGPYGAIAVGLIAYGGYELLNARYRRIRPA